MLLPATCPLCRRRRPWPCLRCIVSLPGAPAGEVPALFAYSGPGRELLVSLKFRNGRMVLPWLGGALARLAPAGGVDVVTWAPTHHRRRRARGYDQAELLARATATALRVPCRALLVRVDHSGPQTGRPRVDRVAGPAFTASSGVPRRVLVVDDVVTTGATLRAARGALESGGARVVVAVAAAATPLARPAGARS